MCRKIELVTVLFMCVSVTGCLSSKSYIDPQFRKAVYSDIGKVATKYKGNIDVEFHKERRTL